VNRLLDIMEAKVTMLEKNLFSSLHNKRPFRERRATSDATDLGGSTGDLTVDDIGGTGETRALMCSRHFVPYTGGKPKGCVPQQRGRNNRLRIKLHHNKRQLADVLQVPSAKRTKLGEGTSVSSYRDMRYNAESYFVADKETICTLESSKGDFTGRVVHSSKPIKRKLLVPCSEERIECPFKVFLDVNCGGVDSQFHLVGHSIKDHGAEVQEKSGPFVVKLQDVSESSSFLKAIVKWGKLFYLLWVKKEDIMHFLVYVTPKQTSEEYTYDFKLKKGQKEISITGGICSSLKQPPCEGREKGDIIRIHYHKVKRYLDKNDNLSCIIEIRRQDGTHSSGKDVKARVPDRVHGITSQNV